MTYKQFIQDIIEERGQWPEEVYYSERGCEKHHIIPICIGGTGDYKNNRFRKKSKHINCIYLYPSEHFIAHKLLYLENKDNIDLARAWITMAYFKSDNQKRDYEITPEEYELARLAAIAINKTIDHSDNSWVTDEFREKQRADKTGKHWYNNGEDQVFTRECPEGYTAGMLHNSSHDLAAGTTYFTNGIIEVRRKECPEGFKPGRLVTDKMRKHNAEIGVGRHWYNNGEKEVYVKECPDGYIAGRLK